MKLNSVCIACSIFKSELQALKTRGLLDLPLRFLDSALHMKPEELHERLASQMGNELKQSSSVILVYGDCHAHMREMETHPNVSRTRGVNCCEIILGRDAYRKYRKDGCFFLIPEWSRRWQEYFQLHLGLDKNIAPDFMQEMHSKILYLDTELVPVPTKDLKEFSDYCGLPYEIITVPLEHLALSISEAKVKLTQEIR